MLNIPHNELRSQNSEVRTNSNLTYLEQLISLRKKINELEFLISEIMPLALNESLEILSNKEDNNIVYADKTNGKIVVTFRKQYPTPKDNVTLQRLDDEIKAETKLLVKTHQSELSELEQQLDELNQTIEQLESEKEKLTTNKRLINLKLRFKIERENSMELIPNLSVYLK
ncbi:hypothetical protein [Geminocystis sp. GBBB08]|uniref:hypothetical protein n=1 Tax=Geminocystis sp. GBBB08 TaxID=2604140 RepID=UPI0027E294C5|nr:hypothetical protein [Geminocystis sp. GBBB08]MBL1208284.1 hypothetical protein [Geminocystis sp. GBBB08]